MLWPCLIWLKYNLLIFSKWWCWPNTEISPLSVFFCLLSFFISSVLGCWQGLSYPWSLPHRLHRYWSVHCNLHSFNVSLSTRHDKMSWEDAEWTHFGTVCVFDLASWRLHLIRVLNKNDTVLIIVIFYLVLSEKVLQSFGVLFFMLLTRFFSLLGMYQQLKLSAQPVFLLLD